MYFEIDKKQRLERLEERLQISKFARFNQVNIGQRSLMESKIPNEVKYALKDVQELDIFKKSVLIGGVAIDHYIRSRYTEDIDLMFLNNQRIPSIEYWTNTPFKPLSKKDNKSFYLEHTKTGVVLELVTPKRVNLNPRYAAYVYKTSIWSDKIRIASIEGLILNKIAAGRPRDLVDITYLLENPICDLSKLDGIITEEDREKLEKLIPHDSIEFEGSSKIEEHKKMIEEKELEVHPLVEQCSHELEDECCINEDYTDRMLQYMDETMIKYMNDNLNDPSKRKTFLLAVERFRRMAEMATDPKERIYYEFRCYLPADQARILANEYYQKEVRSNTWNDSSLNRVDQDNSEDAEIEGGLISFQEFGNSGSNFGMFSQMMDGSSEVATTGSGDLNDLFTKVIYHKSLNEKDRIYLVANLMFGAGPGNRQDLSKSIDLEDVMDNPPKKEIKLIMDKVKELIKIGFPKNKITKEVVISGGYDPNKNYVSGLIGKTQKEKSEVNVQNVILKMFGKKDFDQLQNFFFGESMENIGVRDRTQFTEDNKTDLSSILRAISGGSVPAKDFIPVLGKALQLNYTNKTILSKSKLLSNPKKAFKDLYRLVRSKDQFSLARVQNVIMAPVLDRMIKSMK